MYVAHCILAGPRWMHIFNVGVGMTFSGGLIDLTSLASSRVMPEPTGSGW